MNVQELENSIAYCCLVCGLCHLSAECDFCMTPAYAPGVRCVISGTVVSRKACRGVGNAVSSHVARICTPLHTT